MTELTLIHSMRKGIKTNEEKIPSIYKFDLQRFKG